MAKYAESKQPKSTGSKGFGLTLSKSVCDKYGIKTGPYSKVKKQINLWAALLHDQSQGIFPEPKVEIDHQAHQEAMIEQILQMVEQGKNKHSQNKNQQFEEKHQHNPNCPKNQQQQQQLNINNLENGQPDSDSIKGKVWYWLSDHKGLKWIPYRQNDLDLINSAWIKKDKSVVIKSGAYRVEFNYDNIQHPTAYQYNCSVQNPQSRTVKCSVPQSTIFGVTVDKNPL